MRYHNITTDDMLNGSGLRTVLWVAGCDHHCKKCHNPVTWDINGGVVFDEAAKIELFDKLSKPYISGITFSGGDPMHIQNRDTVLELAKEIKATFSNKDIWMYTGYIFDEIKDHPIMSYIDVLVDGPFIYNLRDVTYHWAGSTNQNVIDVQQSLKTGSMVLYDNQT